MTSTRDWLRERRAVLERLPRLEDALLGASPFGYAAYRLKLVGLRALLRTAFRLAELAFFATALSFEVLGPVLLVRSLMFVLEGLWWGALETLRRDVRTLHAVKQSPVRVIRQWMALSCLVAFGVGAFSGCWVAFGPSPFVGFDVIDAFLLGCALRWAMDSISRTYHSGVYGIRRVYRPAWSLVLVDVADIVGLVVSYLWLGAWGLGPSLVVVGALRTSLAVSFTRRTYAALRVALGSFSHWFRALSGASWSMRHTVASALGNAIAQLDAFFVLGLLLVPLNEEGGLLLAALFHGVAPLQAAAFSWSRLFYFDFKRLESWGSPFLLERFDAFLNQVSLWVPLPVGVVTLGLLAAFWDGPYWLLVLGLTALAAVRSRLALLHVRAFSLSDYAFLRKLFAFMVFVVLTTPLVGLLPPDFSMLAVAAVAALGLLLLDKPRPLAPRPGTILGLATWLRRLAKHSSPLCIGLFRVDRRLSSSGRAIHALREHLTGATLARLGTDSVVWFAEANVASVLSTSDLVAASAGTLRELHLGPLAESGRDALRAGVDSEVWKTHLAPYLKGDDSEPRDVEWLRERLKELAPDARCIDLPNLERKALSGCSARELRGLVLDAARGRTGFTRLGSAEATVLAPSGEPRALVLFPPGPKARLDWKAKAAESIRAATVTLSVRDEMRSNGRSR